MAAGFVVVNKTKRSEIFHVIEEIEDVIFVMFFVLAGMRFDLMMMKAGGILALLIVLGRCAGKFLGARTGATLSHAPTVVKNYLGFALLPKAGVTVGLVILAGRAFPPAISAIMINAVLASVIINELIAPPLTKYAIFKAGEAAVA
jgi:Kef-type K+ transport system membrane component KefB